MTSALVVCTNLHEYLSKIFFILSIESFLDAVTKLDTPFDVFKFDCKDMISNSEAFKLRQALLTMTFKKKSCDLYSFSQSSDFIRSTNIKKPKEVEQFLIFLEKIKQNIATYLGKTFNNMISVSCSKYDHGGNFFFNKLQYVSFNNYIVCILRLLTLSR